MEPKDIIKNARELKGWTQSQLADIVGISGRMIQRYEEGKFPKYKSDKIKKLDGVLGINIYETLYDKINDNSAHAESNRYIDKLIQVMEDRRRDAEETAKKMEAHYQNAIAEKDRLLKTLDKNQDLLEKAQNAIIDVLKPIKEKTETIETNSVTIRDQLAQVGRMVRADDLSIMDALDRLEGNATGTLSREASTVEHAFGNQGEEDDTSDKKSKTGKAGKVR